MLKSTFGALEDLKNTSKWTSEISLHRLKKNLLTNMIAHLLGLIRLIKRCWGSKHFVSFRIFWLYVGLEEILPLCLVKVEHVWIEIAKIFANGIVVVCQRFDRAKIITRRMRRSWGATSLGLVPRLLVTKMMLREKRLLMRLRINSIIHKSWIF